MTINYMASEVNLFIGKVILSSGEPDGKYASKFEVTQNMEVNFYVYNTETKTTACKSYTYEDFANMCMNKDIMEHSFRSLAEILIDKANKISSSIIYVTIY